MSVRTETLFYLMEQALDGACTEEFARIANMKLNDEFIPIREDMIRKFHHSLQSGLDHFVDYFNTNTKMGDTSCLNHFSQNLDTCKIPSKKFCPFEAISSHKIVPGYLHDMVDSFGGKVLKYMDMNEDMSPEEENLLHSHQLGDIVTKQCIRDGEYSPNEFLDKNSYENQVIPFTTNFVGNKEALIKECDELKTVMANNVDKLCEIANKINTRYEDCPIDNKVMKLNRCVFDLMYNMFLVCKNICNCYVDKLNSFYNSTEFINKTCEDIRNNPSINESVYDNTFVPVNTEDLSGRLIEGDVSAYKEFAENVYDFHSGIFHNKYEVGESDGINDNFDTYVSNFKYNKEVYIDILNMFQNIFDSLNVLSKNSDDYLLVFDDMLKKSGLTVNLKDRFFNDLELIDKITQYSEPVAGGENMDMYYRILNDIKNYPINMESIAGMIRDVYTQACDLRNRFEMRINGEFANSQAIVELQNYMADFDDQFKYIVNIVAAKTMARLKELAYLAEHHSLVINDNDKAVGFIEDVDFTEGSVENDLEIHRIYNESEIRELSMDYYKADSFNRYGIHVVFTEADDDNQNAQNNTATNTNQTQTADKNNTKVTVTDNSSDSSNTEKTTNPSVLKNIAEAVQKWFDDVLNRFDTLCERQASKNTKWLDNNKDVLNSRRYVNVSASILPYEENMDNKKLLNELSSAAANISTVKSKLNTLNSEADVIKALFPNVKNTDPAQFSDDCVRYFKVGTAELAVKQYLNNELGNLVKTSILPFCESYYSTYVNSVKDNVNKIKTAVAGATEDVKTESYVSMEDGYLIYEADEEDKSSGLKQKMDWVRKYAKLYTGSALNAIRDRNNDYFKLLAALVPKTRPNLSENENKE